MFAAEDTAGFSSSHCWAPKPIMKNNHNVMILVSIVAVAAHAPGTPIEMKRVVITASGSPTSNGIPTGIDLTAKNMAEVTRIMLHETGCPSDTKTRYGMLRLKNQDISK